MTAIQKHMMATFLTLRVGVGVAGIVLPILLWSGGLRYGFNLAGSMSAYYHATKECVNPNGENPMPAACLVQGTGPMRNWFVGALFFIGSAMYLLKGFSRWEDYALNIAGVMALGVALNPMPWPSGTGVSAHYVCALIFFGCIAFTSLFCSGKTLKEMPPGPDRDKVIAKYKTLYRILAGAMILSPVAAVVVTYAFPAFKGSLTFFLEAFGVWAFGAYWLVKTAELKRSDVERRALEGRLEMDPRSLR